MYGSGRIRISYRSGGKPDKGMGQGAYRGRRGEGRYSQSPFPRRIHFYFLFAFFARLLPINWMSWTTTIRTRMVATMTSAWKRW